VEAKRPVTSEQLRAAVAEHEERARAAAAVYQREAAKLDLSDERDKLSSDLATDVIAFAEMQCNTPSQDELAALEFLRLNRQDGIETWQLGRCLRIWKEALDELAYIEAVRREYGGDANWTTPH
jgi:hypothetical protein